MKKINQMREPSHMWKKEEIRELFLVWDKYTLDELAEQLGVTRKQIVYITTIMRKNGFNLPKKSQRGYLQSLLKEVRDELKDVKKAHA